MERTLHVPDSRRAPMRRFLMRRPLLAVLLFCSAAAGLSCRDATGPAGGWRTFPVAGSLVIVNEREAPLYALVFDESLLPLIDWVPVVCEDCGAIAPRSTRRIPVDSIMGAAPGSVVIVNTWRAVRNANGTLVPGEVSARRVRLGAAGLP